MDLSTPDFTTIIQNIRAKGDLPGKYVDTLASSCAHWRRISPQTFTALLSIRDTYRFENQSLIPDAVEVPAKVEFWKDMMCFTLSPALEDGDFDRQFLGFVPDVLESPDWQLAPFEDDSGEQENTFWELMDRLFYAWVGYLWQEIEGHSVLVPVSTVENNSTKMFYLNDFLFGDYSPFLDWDCEKLENGTVFTRKLSLDEIFLRTELEEGLGEKEVVWHFRKADAYQKLTKMGDKTVFMDGNGNSTTASHTTEKEPWWGGRFAARHLAHAATELLNSGWKQTFE